MPKLPHQRNPIFVLPTALLAASLALTACGSSDDDPAAPPTTPVPAPPPPSPPPPPPPPPSTIVPPASSGFVEARTSQIVTDGSPPSAVFDDFTPTANITIRTVRWQGIYCVQQLNAPAPNPTASSFTVSFYTDVSGRPSPTPVQTSTYPVAQTGQVFEKNVSGLTCGTAMNTTWPFYLYAVTLATPFGAVAGTKYWISIQATTPSYAVYFGWRDGTPDNNMSLQLFQGVYTTFNVDRAYALEL